MSSLTPDQVALQLDALQGWQQDGNTIIKTYQFPDFAAAIGFMVQASFHAQALEHYPTWQNYYNEIVVRIGDTNQGELHSRDIQLAKRLESVFGHSR